MWVVGDMCQEGWAGPYQTNACNEHTDPFSHQPGPPVTVTLPVLRYYFQRCNCVNLIAIVVIITEEPIAFSKPYS